MTFPSSLVRNSGGGGVTANPAWATQAAWYINASTGSDTNAGTALAPIKTWAELRRRIIAVGGFTNPAGTTITIETDLPDSDPLDISAMYGYGAGYITVQGTTTVVRTGMFTSYAARNAASNLPNIATDTGITDWTADIAINTGHIINVTSGAANGCQAWVAKDLGGHQARVSTFIDVLNTFTEQQPTVGDTYQILSCPFIRNFNFSSPNNSGWNFNYLNLGDASSTLFFYGQDNPSYISLNNCAFLASNFTNSCPVANNSAMKSCPGVYSTQFQFSAGVIGNILGPGSGYIEVEDGAEIILDKGAIFQGAYLLLANYGYTRVYDAGFFDTADSAQAAVVIGFSAIRSDILWGSNNVSYGVFVNTGGQFYYTANCTIAGTVNAVNFMQKPLSWSGVQTLKYVKAETSNTSMSLWDNTDIPVQNADNLVNIVTNVDLTTIGQTAILSNLASNAVPTGKTFVLTDIKIVPTTATAVTVAPQVSVGVVPSYNTWAGTTTLTGLNAANQYYSLAQASNGAVRTVFSASSVPKFDVSTGATATALVASLHVFGYFY